jgi:hypothetical protein
MKTFKELSSENLKKFLGGMNKAQLIDAIAAEANLTSPPPPPPPAK